MSVVDELVKQPPFAYSAQSRRLFIEAMDEAVSWHYAHCPEYRNYLDISGFAPQIRTETDIERLPFVHVNVYKEYDLKSVPDPEIKLMLTSSGTGGKKSKIFLDQISLDRVVRMARNVYGALGMVNDQELVNYCCFTYDPHVAKDLGTAFTDELLTGFTKKKRVYYTFQFNQTTGSFEIDRHQVVQVLQEFEKEGLPVRILGFPAFIYDILEFYEKNYQRQFTFHPNSFLLTGGGWKKQEDQKVGRDFFVQYIHKTSGVPCANMRDLFGMVEHGVAYVECALGNMHVPIYGKIFIKDPDTLESLPYGQPGLANFITPYLHSYPSISILVNDFAVLQPSCPCGLPGEVLKVLGRAGITKHTGCALHAEKSVHVRGT